MAVSVTSTSLMGKHFSDRAGRVEAIYVHHMTIVGDGRGSANDACYRVWQTREASAHYGVDGSDIRRFVPDDKAAWATGSTEGNHRGISVEHANSTKGPRWEVSDETWRNGARLVAELHVEHGLGRPVAGKTLRKHSDVRATACPGPYMDSIWPQYVAEVQRVYDELTSGAAKPAPKPASKPQPAAKTVQAMAAEVMAGKHGSGHDNRRRSLGVSAGVYEQVRAEVNRRAGGGSSTPAPSRPSTPSRSIRVMADEVIAGKHGSGHDNRRRSLGVSEAVYEQVRAEVNRRAGITSAAPSRPRKSVSQMATEVIRGEHGSGHAARRKSLGIDAATYAQVRAEVNRRA